MSAANQFSQRNHFNTVGNILLNPKAGFLFVDFDTGDLVYTTGQAEIVWDGEEVEALVAAELIGPVSRVRETTNYTDVHNHVKGGQLPP